MQHAKPASEKANKVDTIASRRSAKRSGPPRRVGEFDRRAGREIRMVIVWQRQRQLLQPAFRAERCSATGSLLTRRWSTADSNYRSLSRECRYTLLRQASAQRRRT